MQEPKPEVMAMLAFGANLAGFPSFQAYCEEFLVQERLHQECMKELRKVVRQAERKAYKHKKQKRARCK